jgi:hypothetical protein
MSPSRITILLAVLALSLAACITTVPASQPPASPGPTRAAVVPTATAAVVTDAPTEAPIVTDAPTAPPTDAPTAPPTDAPTAAPATAPPSDPPAATPDPWRANATQYRGDPTGTRHTIECPPGGEPATVWGTTFYTDDSSICTAAVHRGAITFEAGGTVTFEMQPGQDSYEGSTQNGVTSLDYGTWAGSFVIVME